MKKSIVIFGGLLAVLIMVFLAGCAGMQTGEWRKLTPAQAAAIEAQQARLAAGKPTGGQPYSLEQLQQLTAGTGASKVRAFDHLVGNDTGALDKIDGDNVAAGDFTFTVDDTSPGSYMVHYFVASGSCSTNDSPWVIYPASCAADTNKGYWRLPGQFYLAPSQEPGYIGRDSDQGTMQVVRIYGDAADANDSIVRLQVSVGGSLVTYITLDGVNEKVTLGANLDLGAHSLTVNSVEVVGADGEVNDPAIASTIARTSQIPTMDTIADGSTYQKIAADDVDDSSHLRRVYDSNGGDYYVETPAIFANAHFLLSDQASDITVSHEYQDGYGPKWGNGGEFTSLWSTDLSGLSDFTLTGEGMRFSASNVAQDVPLVFNNPQATYGVHQYIAKIDVWDLAYNESTWDDSNSVPTRNAVRDKFEAFDGAKQDVLTIPLNGLMDGAIISPADADDMIYVYVQKAATITDILCIAQGTTPSITLTLQKCDDAACASPTTIESAITCNGGQDEDDGTIDSGSIPAGTWIKVLFGEPTGTVSSLAWSVLGTQTW